MPITIRQVAAKAGVSPAVVSRVLHNKAEGVRVSEATAVRVREAAEQLGYRCNVLARSFRNQQTYVIGVLHGVGFERPSFRRGSRYFGNLMDGLIEGAFAHGYSITLCPQLLGASPEDALSDGRFDGLVWYSNIPSEANRRMLQSANVPLVVVHGTAEDYQGRFPTVICDNFQGIGLAVDHLWSLGHREIAFGMSEGFSAESMARRDAFLRHMSIRGADVGPADIVQLVSQDARRDWLANPRRKHSAVITENDDLAGPVIQTARELGVSVPGSIAVVGFDSTTYCNELRPTLTSVFQPLVDMGETAINLLMGAISGDKAANPHVIYPCGLDVRESTTSAILSAK